MAIAADLDQAAYFAMRNARIVFDGGTTLRSKLMDWFKALAAPFDPQNTEERTVSNWVPIGRPLEQSLPTAKANEDFGNANDVGLYLFRSCQAAQLALAQGRITAGQGAAILASYNAIWG